MASHQASCSIPTGSSRMDLISKGLRLYMMVTGPQKIARSNPWVLKQGCVLERFSSVRPQSVFCRRDATSSFRCLGLISVGSPLASNPTHQAALIAVECTPTAPSGRFLNEILSFFRKRAAVRPKAFCVGFDASSTAFRVLVSQNRLHRKACVKFGASAWT